MAPQITLAASTLASEGGVAADGEVTVSLAAGSDKVARGGTIAVTVEIQNAADLSGVDLRLAYDATRLAALDADTDMEGIQMEAGEMLSPDYVVENQVDIDAGTIGYVVAQLPPSPPASGSGAVARMVFRGVASGNAEVRLVDLILADSTGNAVPYQVSAGTVSITVE